MKIIIGDSHPVVINGLSEFITKYTNYSIVGKFTNSYEVIKGYQDLKPDILILDLSLPPNDGYETAKNVLILDKYAKILFFSTNKSKVEIYNCYKLGGKGYLSMNENLNTLIDAINLIFKGKLFFDKSFNKYDYNSFHEKTILSMNNRIIVSSREQELLFYISRGFKNKKIANILNISTKTVENHRRNIRFKINLKGSAELVKYAVEFINQNEIKIEEKPLLK